MRDIRRLRIFGRVDLDGTHRAIVETNLPDLLKTNQNAAQSPALRLSSKDRACGCILAEISSSDENRVFVDRYKLWHLGLNDGDQVEAELFTPTAARRVDIRVSVEFGARDAVRFIGKPLVAGEKTALFTFSGEPRVFTIKSTEPKDIITITPTTEIVLADTEAEAAPITYKDIGGLDYEVNLLRELVEYPLKFGEVFTHLGVTPPKGIILYGSPGTGKTLLARALANQVGARFYSISGPEIYSKWYGKSEQNLRNIFDEATKNAPSIVVIDELDALVPRRDKTHGDQEQRIVATFLTQMDGLREMKDVVVVGTTNRINAIDPALRRGGRFEKEILISVPDAKGREKILSIHTRRMPLGDDVDLQIIAEKANGHVGADLASLCREAAYNALRRAAPPEAFETGSGFSHEQITVNQADFMEAIRTVTPSAAREFSLEVPPITWDDIGGLSDTKQILIENITNAISKREEFAKAGIRPASGLLLYGPTGTGKTLLARAVACECGTNFIAVRGSELRSRWLGEAEEHIRFLFSRARLLAPCVIFFDEIDSAIPIRGKDPTGSIDSIVNQLLLEMDGIEDQSGVFVMGATNRVDAVDPAALRPGRFDYHVAVPMPDPEARKAIFRVHLKGKPVGQDLDLGRLAESSEGFNGAQIAEICREAALHALRETDYDADSMELTIAHLDEAIGRIRRTCAGFLAANPQGTDSK